MSVRLFIGGIPKNTIVKDITDMLEDKGFGDEVPHENVTIQTPPGRGSHIFVNVDTNELAERIISECNGISFFGRPLRVEISRMRSYDSPGYSPSHSAPRAPDSVQYKLVAYPVSTPDEKQAILDALGDLQPARVFLKAQNKELSLSFSSPDVLSNAMELIKGKCSEVYEDTIFNRRSKHMAEGSIPMPRAGGAGGYPPRDFRESRAPPRPYRGSDW
eukprot:gnl/Chilomastix_cuspidata/671.p1 GENE.gnl/Chilomastix_cuspidata/671~~gnl/Chilomastix_cuspidata/671.p1  ORF type:complete len:217 (-),score=87.97 gnl/Chilomastix_cuspidata/671:718-1368(-)